MSIYAGEDRVIFEGNVDVKKDILSDLSRWGIFEILLLPPYVTCTHDFDVYFNLTFERHLKWTSTVNWKNFVM